MAALNTTLEDVEKTLSASSRHIFGTDALVVVDATFTGTQCGPFVSHCNIVTLKLVGDEVNLFFLAPCS